MNGVIRHVLESEMADALVEEIDKWEVEERAAGTLPTEKSVDGAKGRGFHRPRTLARMPQGWDRCRRTRTPLIMSIKFECPHCQKKLHVPDEMAGKKGRCTSCKSPIVVPGTPAPAPTKPVPATAAVPARGGDGADARIASIKPPPLPPPAARPEDIEALAAEAFTDKPVQEEKVEDEKIKFECEYCSFALEVDAELGGKRTQCPDCRRITRVPEAVKRVAKEWHRAAQTEAENKAAEAAREGAWGTANIKSVDQKALQEEGILPDDTPPATPVQLAIRWSVRGLLALGVLSLFLYGYNRISRWGGASKELELRRLGILVASEDRVSPEGLATLRTELGDHYRREGRARDGSEPGSVKDARYQFALAAHYLADRTGPDRDFALTRLALAESELGGNGNDVIGEVREKWDEVQRGLRTTLTAIQDSEARSLALRAVCRRLIARKQADRARSLALQTTEPAGTSGDERADRADMLARAGLEFLAGDRPQAEDIANHLAHFSDKEGGSPPLRPAVVAFLTALKLRNVPPPAPYAAPLHPREMTLEEKQKARLEANRAAVEHDVAEIGEVEALARQGRFDEARRRAEPLEKGPQLRALVGLAEAAGDANPADRTAFEAVCTFAAAMPADPQDNWTRVRLVERAARAGLTEDRLQPVAALIDSKELRGRAQFAIFRGTLARARSAPEESAVDVVEPGTLGQQLAVLELARSNTRRSSGYADKVAGLATDKEHPWSVKGLRAFGIIGALVGLQGAADAEEP